MNIPCFKTNLNYQPIIVRNSIVNQNKFTVSICQFYKRKIKKGRRLAGLSGYAY